MQHHHLYKNELNKGVGHRWLANSYRSSSLYIYFFSMGAHFHQSGKGSAFPASWRWWPCHPYWWENPIKARWFRPLSICWLVFSSSTIFTPPPPSSSSSVDSSSVAQCQRQIHSMSVTNDDDRHPPIRTWVRRVPASQPAPTSYLVITPCTHSI